MRDFIGKEATRYGPDNLKPRREKKASKTRRGKRKKFKSDRYIEHDTMLPGKRTRGYVVEPARYVEGEDPKRVEIERKLYRRKAGTGKKGKVKTIRYANGGLASAAKTIAGKTTRSRNKTKPRGVGVATRGFGKALK